MSTKSKKKYLPLFLNPVDTSERHYQLFGSVNTRADTKVVFSEFLKKKVFQEDLNAIAKYVAIKDPYSLSASQFRRIPETETDKFPIKVFELAIAQEEVNSEDPVTINYRKALEPKVSLPFKPRVGTTTRKIELERRKRLYSSLDIEKLIDQELDGLKAKGLLNPNVSQFPNFRGTQVEISATEEVSVYQETDYTLCLPLNLFDDTEFDPRTVDDWLDMGALPDGDVNPHFKGNYRFHKRGYSKPGYPDIRFATIPLPAKAFDGNKWRNCIVIAYDEKIGDWKVKWRNYNGWELDKPLAKGEVFTHSEDINLVTEIKESSGNPRAIDEGREAWVYRINLMFLAEDPTNFSKRVANAYYLRHQAVLYIKYNFYIDCMPQSNGAIGDPNDGLPQFFDNFERFGKSEVSAGGLDGLKNEVAVEYDRAHNKLLFDLEMSSKSNDFSTGLPLFYAVPNKQEMDLILPGYRMADAKKRFTTATFLTSVEVLRNLSIARGECDRLIVYEMFPIMSKVVNLSEFRQIQYRSISDMRIYLQQEWIAKLGDAVLSGFSEVGKGWYNTEESNIEVYKIGKLSNCMKVLTFMMQDSLRTFMISSLEAFANQICQYPTSQIAISGLKNIEINGDANFLFNLHKKPLFAVKIRSDGEKFQYDTDLEDLEKAVVAIMAEAVAVTENLPQLETLVLRNIFFATKPVLQRIFPDDPEVLNLQSRVAQAIKGSILKLKEYLCYFDEYFKIMKIDVGQFAAEYEASNKSLDEMNNDILYYSEEWKTIEENIPRHLTIGLFSISCEDAISSLNKNLGRVILDLIAKKALALVNTILENFLKIQTQLEEKPRDEDDIILLRQFLETVPVLVESNAALLIEVQNHCAVLDSYNYERSKDDHQATWTALSWPKRIEEKLTELKILFEEEDRSVVVEVPVDVEESI